MGRTWMNLNWKQMGSIFPLFLNNLCGSKYWIPEEYVLKLWHFSDVAVTNLLELF